MKSKYLLIKLIFAGAIAFVGIIAFKPDHSARQYQSRESIATKHYSANGALEYMWWLKSNPNTNSLDANDILKAKQQLSAMPKFKSGNSDWVFRGPDNIGGRTRALLIDKDNSAILYAGGVAGGLWKSKTSGQYWEQVQYSGLNSSDFDYLTVSSICQAANGDIYFGTGEGFWGNHGTNIATPMIYGSGIWKSTDGGATFSKLNSTWTTSEEKETFLLTYKLAADPTNANIIYAATRRGLKVSTDAGATWNNAPVDATGYDIKTCTDVKTASNGSVIASIGNVCFVKKAGASVFSKKSGSDTDAGGTLITTLNVSRMEFAYAPSDPNYIYCITCGSDERINKIYASRDGGDSWVIIGKGGSEFQPLGTQGTYDMAIAVFAGDKDKIIIGGLDVWYGRKTSAGTLFAWAQVSDWTGSTASKYVHADIHTFVFDLKSPKTFFIGSDGGVGRCIMDKNGEPFTFNTMNKNYGVTQYYGFGVNSKGQLVGGTQDNGSLLITGEGNSPKNAITVTGGDGGHAAASNIVPSLVFTTLYYGGLFRNIDADFRDFQTFYASNIINFHWAPNDTYTGDPLQGSFVTPIAYWETANDPNNGDTLTYICEKEYPKESVLYLESRNIRKAPIKLVLDKTYQQGETIYYHDPYTTLFALGMSKTIWLTRGAARIESMYERDWWRGIKARTLNETDANNPEKVTQITISKDGNNVFFATDYGQIFRISNLNQAYTELQGSFKVNGKDNVPLTTVTKIGSFGNRTVTGIASDPNNVNNILVTLGNYGAGDDYIYFCNHAITATASNTTKNFIDITDNLPKAPAYCALFEMNPSAERVLVGTDLGVFMAEGVMSQASSTITWNNYSENIGTVPVFQIKQQTYDCDNYGVIYIATHGLGIWENRTYLGVNPMEPQSPFSLNEKIDVRAYPNPMISELNVNYNLKESGPVNVELINMAGQVVKTSNEGLQTVGEHESLINVQNLKSGSYLLRVSSGSSQKTIKILKQ